MLEKEFTETVDTAAEGGTVVSKIGEIFCAATGGVTSGGRGGTKSKMGLHGVSGSKKVSHRFVRLMMDGGNTSCEMMSVSAIMVVRRDGFCCCRRESANQNSADFDVTMILLQRLGFV